MLFAKCTSCNQNLKLYDFVQWTQEELESPEWKRKARKIPKGDMRKEGYFCTYCEAWGKDYSLKEIPKPTS